MNLEQLQQVLLNDRLTWRDRAESIIETAMGGTQRELEDHFAVLIHTNTLNPADAEALIKAIEQVELLTDHQSLPEMLGLVNEIKELESKREQVLSEHDYIAYLQVEIQELERLKQERLKLRNSIQLIITTVRTDIERIDALKKEADQ